MQLVEAEALAPAADEPMRGAIDQVKRREDQERDERDALGDVPECVVAHLVSHDEDELVLIQLGDVAFSSICHSLKFVSDPL